MHPEYSSPIRTDAAMKRIQRIALSIATAALLFLAGCGGGDDAPADDSATGGADQDGLTAEQIEHGIGPISAFDPGPIDPDLVAQGEKVFQTNCSACHKMDSRYVGPSLGDVTERRSPAFVMNMILNPEQMIKEHPEGKKMFAEYMTPMANQNMTEEQARAILEYLRTQAPSN